MSPATLDSDLLRALRRLAPKGTQLEHAAGDAWQIRRAAGGTATVATDVAETLVGRGLVVAVTDGTFVIADAGAAWLRRALAGGDDAFAAQHQDRASAIVTDETGAHAVLVNADESPLAWLRRRRDRHGQPMVDAASFSAGERLRADYSRGQLMPRVTANWTAAVAGRGRGAGGSSAEITEVAIAARRRVERALDAVGPELGGLLVDFCCFLKGLEAIEADRQWPPRSAKVALKIALAGLARHYGLAREARGRGRSAGIVQWGTEDYRPTLD